MPAPPCYRVLIPSGIEYPTDPAIIRRIIRGEPVSFAQRQHKRAEPGDIVSDIPKDSVPALLRKGWIERVDASEGGE